MQKHNQAKQLKLWTPNGHLDSWTAMFLQKMGYALPGYPNRRNYRITLREKHISVRISRPMDIAIALARGDADIGITGLDCLYEFAGARLLWDLKEPVTRLVFGLSDSSEFDHITDMRSFCAHLRRQPATIHTEYPRFLWRYFSRRPEYLVICSESPVLDLGWPVLPSNSPLTIRSSYGCTEGNDFFVDCVQTGKTLKDNNCRSIHTVLKHCTPYLVASYSALADPWKRMKMSEICTRLYTSLSGQSVTSTVIEDSINIAGELVNRRTVVIESSSYRIS